VTISNHKLALALASTILLVACAGISTEHALLTTRSAAPSEEVTEIVDGQAIPENLEEVALLRATVKGFPEHDEMVRALKSHAQELGCTTIALIRSDKSDKYLSYSCVCLRPRG
jgi:hypothetical protein